MRVQDLIDKAGGVGKLAALCKVSHSTVCDWNRANALPGHRLPRISAALGIEPALLIPLVNEPKSKMLACEAA